MTTGCWTELNQDRLRGNLHLARQALRPETAMFFVVKSDAYGHGLAPVVRCALGAGVEHFAVAHVDEGMAVRALAPHATILVLCAPPPETVPEMLMHRLIPMIVGPEHGAALAAAVPRTHPAQPLTCHFKIDTGMSRLGFDWNRAPDDIHTLTSLGSLRAVGIASHLAGTGGEAAQHAICQFRRFMSVIGSCRRRGITFASCHISASGGFCENPLWDLDAVRLGILLYGYAPEKSGRRLPVEPVLEWKTRILQVKKLPRGRTVGYEHTHITRSVGRIAILAAGYADGYNRHLSNRGFVLIDSRRCPVVGRVSMNLTSVNLPHDCHAEPGDEAVLIGHQGRNAIGADELAALCDTIPYEILTSIRHDDAMFGSRL